MTATTNFPAGLRLGPYEILNLLGVGGMGEVYRARDTRLRRDVAVKMLPPAVADDPELLRRLQREARAVGQLNHANIVAIYDIGSQAGYEYVVMELLEGETLATRLRSGPLSPRKALEFAMQIARGLAAAHEKHIIHRDLKPENIFITRDGRVKILDFGLAREMPTAAVSHQSATAARLTMPGMVVGTAAYMSPEQARGLRIDQRSDIFSLGVVMYEMLTGTNPFDAPSAIEAMSAILSREPSDLAEVVPNVPVILRRVVHHCLEKKPEDRFQAVNDLIFDLESCSEINLGAAATGMFFQKKPRLWPRVAAIAAVVALLAAAVTALVLKAVGTDKPAAPYFRRMTFGRGIVQAARFTGDGRTIVYSAAWKGQPLRLFLLRTERAAEAQTLALPSANLSAISSTGEMAIVLSSILMDWRFGGTLAQVPVLGGTPRELLEGVIHADWSPDGRLVVMRRTDKGAQLEFPIGKVLLTTDQFPLALRMSPKGDRIAVHIMGSDLLPNELAVIGLDGSKRTLVKGMHASPGLAWTPDGEEVWFSASPTDDSTTPPSIYAVGMDGRRRLVARMTGWLWPHDISRDGTVLMTYNTWQSGIILPGSPAAPERELSWLDWSVLADISSDGKQVLFTESREGVGNKAYVYMRGTDDSPPVRLGEGAAIAFSPDTQWVLAVRSEGSGSRREFMILPTKAGEPRTLPNQEVLWAGWLPDGRILIAARTPQGSRMSVIARDGSGERPITPPGVSIGYIGNDGGTAAKPISPDGRWVAVFDRSGKGWLYPIGEGQPRPLGGMLRGDRIAGWSRDGERLYVYQSREMPVRMYQVRVATGERTFLRELTLSDLSGVYKIEPVLVMPDGESFAIGYKRMISTLYTAEGLR